MQFILHLSIPFTNIMSLAAKNTRSKAAGLFAHRHMVVGPPFILPKRSAADMTGELDEDNPAKKSKLVEFNDPAGPGDVVLPPLVLSKPTTAHHGEPNHLCYEAGGLDSKCGPHNRECVAQALSEASVPWIEVVHAVLLTQPKDDFVNEWQHYFDDAQLLAVHRWFSAGPKCVISPDVVCYSISKEDAVSDTLHGMLAYMWYCSATSCEHCGWGVTFRFDQCADGTINVEQVRC